MTTRITVNFDRLDNDKRGASIPIYRKRIRYLSKKERIEEQIALEGLKKQFTPKKTYEMYKKVGALSILAILIISSNANAGNLYDLLAIGCGSASTPSAVAYDNYLQCTAVQDVCNGKKYTEGQRISPEELDKIRKAKIFENAEVLSANKINQFCENVTNGEVVLK